MNNHEETWMKYQRETTFTKIRYDNLCEKIYRENEFYITKLYINSNLYILQEIYSRQYIFIIISDIVNLTVTVHSAEGKIN